MEIVANTDIEAQKITQFFVTQWGSAQMVISSGVYHCDQLDGYTMLNDEKEIVGLITYVYDGDEIEIVSLDSLIENKGVGSLLLSSVEEKASKLHCRNVKLITTNDNLRALKFYQKRSYRLAAIYTDAVERARKIKPQIPVIGDHGIPICDELLLKKKITHYV
ncbi:Acetyltransferase (GNAT) family protein [compost metagenome]